MEYLMLKNTEVMQFDQRREYIRVLRPELMPYGLRNAIKEGSDFSIIMNNHNVLYTYLSRRVLGLERKNAKYILNALHLSQDQDDMTKGKIAYQYNNLSMTDAYWFRKGDERYEDMDLRKQDFNLEIQRCALGHPDMLKDKNVITPELLTTGTYAKAWVQEQDGSYLYKKSSAGGRESETEIEVSSILDYTNANHVRYMAGAYDGMFVCKCKNMTTDRLSIVSAEEYRSYCIHNGRDFKKEILLMDAEMIHRMNIVDYLISNSDRHVGNWGFYMDNDTGIIEGCHPLFDHNRAFDEMDMQEADGGKNALFPDYSKKECAQYAVRNCGFEIHDKIPRTVFSSRKHYHSFMERAASLGLIKKKSIWHIKRKTARDELLSAKVPDRTELEKEAKEFIEFIKTKREIQ